MARLLALPLLLLFGAADVRAAGAIAIVELNVGYGTPREAYAQGRVVRDKRVRLPAVHRSGTDNLIDGLKLLESDEVPGVTVEVTLGDVSVRTETDEEGLFSVIFPEPGLPIGRHSLHARVVATPFWHSDEVTSFAMLVPHAEEHVVLVSDFDDTVVVSHVRNKLRMAVNALVRNALQLEPVRGVASAYQRVLDDGALGVVYVSGSPLALFPRIT
ncbi:MAG: phosphatase domain-containing protein, partial [Myxococcota bacterium]